MKIVPYILVAFILVLTSCTLSKPTAPARTPPPISGTNLPDRSPVPSTPDKTTPPKPTPTMPTPAATPVTGGVKKPALINNKILCLNPGVLSEDDELQSWISALETWGFQVETLQMTASYDLVQNGDHWYLHDKGGGSGDVDLVVAGTMQYKVLIFGANSSSSYVHIESETGTPRLCMKMLESYPFIAVGRGQVGYSNSPSVNNLWQISNTGKDARSLNIANPTKIPALSPFEGYTETFDPTNVTLVDQITDKVTVLEYFSDGTSPAITRCDYASGGCALWFGYKTFAHTKTSIFVRLIQQYAGMPYRLPVWSLELDSGAPIPREDYAITEEWTQKNLGGYATFFMINRAIDLNQPPNMYPLNWAPKTFYDRSAQFKDLEAAGAMADLAKYSEYVVGSHGYTHNQPWYTWVASGLPVDGFADQDKDGILNWQDPQIEAGIDNKSNPRLKLVEYGELTDWDLEYTAAKLARVRKVLDSYGFVYSKAFVGGLNQMLDNYTPAQLSAAGFTVISIQQSTAFPITFGYRDGVWVAERVYAINQDPGSENPDTALTGSALADFVDSFRASIGAHPMILMNLHNYAVSKGANKSYELRDSYLPGFLALKKAGYKLLSTQAACNKNIGWLWTTMASNYTAEEKLYLTLTSSAFLDGTGKHELGLVAPFAIKSVKRGSDYAIYVDGVNLYYGKTSGTAESLIIEKGTYDPGIPRLSAISTPATDVLEASYKPFQGFIDLSFSGDFDTEISISNLATRTVYQVIGLGAYKTNDSGVLTFTVPLGTAHKILNYRVVTDASVYAASTKNN